MASINCHIPIWTMYSIFNYAQEVEFQIECFAFPRKPAVYLFYSPQRINPDRTTNKLNLSPRKQCELTRQWLSVVSRLTFGQHITIQWLSDDTTNVAAVKSPWLVFKTNRKLVDKFNNISLVSFCFQLNLVRQSCPNPSHSVPNHTTGVCSCHLYKAAHPIARLCINERTKDGRTRLQKQLPRDRSVVIKFGRQ